MADGTKRSSQSKFKRTSIGRSKNTRPRNKQKRMSWKKYRGQGASL